MLLVITGCEKHQKKEHQLDINRITVTYVKPVQILIEDKLNVTGTLYPNEKVIINNKQPGRVSNIYADLGDYVNQGQVLARLNPVDMNLVYEESMARQHSIRSSLEDIADVQEHSLVRQTRAALDESETKMNRLKKLVDQKLISEQDYDTARANYLAAKAGYDNAVASVKKLSKELEVAKASSKRTVQDIKDTIISAPMSGYIQNREIAKGEYLRIDREMFVLVQTNPIKIKADIPEKYAFLVKKGIKVDFTVDAYTDKVFSGVITRVAPAINTKTHTFEIEVTVNNNDNLLKPGLFARLVINFDTTHQAILIPETAVYTTAGLNKVFTLEQGNKVKEHIVETGVILDDQIEIIGAIKPEDRVINTNVDKLSDNLEVNVVTKKETDEE
jgi:RND family efflux transporter MFP subunit